MSQETTKKALEVWVDRDRCCGYGICAEICPEIYKLDENGMAYTEGGPVPEHLEAAAMEGLENCPEEAIHSNREESEDA